MSIDHARFMAHHFNHHGIPAVAVWGDSPRAELTDGTRLDTTVVLPDAIGALAMKAYDKAVRTQVSE